MALLSTTAARSLVNNLDGAQTAGLLANDCVDFDSHEINSILSQKGCVTLRVYFALNPKDLAGKPTVVLVGADSMGNNITAQNIIVEYGMAHNLAL